MTDPLKLPAEVVMDLRAAARAEARAVATESTKVVSAIHARLDDLQAKALHPRAVLFLCMAVLVAGIIIGHVL
jgi:hypothetical protein